MISVYSDRETEGVLIVPDTVAAGVSFTATVATYGSSTCDRAAGTEVRIRDLLAEIVPYDYSVTDPDAVCTDDLRSFSHDVKLRFARAGESVVRVRGVDGSGTSVTVERRVLVR